MVDDYGFADRNSAILQVINFFQIWSAMALANGCKDGSYVDSHLVQELIGEELEHLREHLLVPLRRAEPNDGKGSVAEHLERTMFGDLMPLPK